jgi:hypothetical protein
MTKSSCRRNKRKINDGDARLARLSLGSHTGFSIRKTDEPSCFISANAASGFGMIEGRLRGASRRYLRPPGLSAGLFV